MGKSTFHCHEDSVLLPPSKPYYYNTLGPLCALEMDDDLDDVELNGSPEPLHFDTSLLDTPASHSHTSSTDTIPSYCSSLPSPSSTFYLPPPYELVQSQFYLPTFPDMNLSSHLFLSPIATTIPEEFIPNCSSVGTGVVRLTSTPRKRKPSPAAESKKNHNKSSFISSKNASHIFVVQIHTKHAGTRPALVNSKTTILVHPRLDTPSSNLPLFQAISMNKPYTASDKQHDVQNSTIYTFTSEATPHWRAGEWILTFTETGEVSFPTIPLQPTSSASSSATSYTFIHFNPNTIIQVPQPLASVSFWRHQVCDVEHDSFPRKSNPERFWGARFDDKFKLRRPVRIVEHFSKCRHREEEGDCFALGKLARAIASSFPETTRRKAERSCSLSGSDVKL